MPLCPQIVNTPITVTQTADFTVSSVIPVVLANTEQVSGALTVAEEALAEAALAYSAASNSIQISSNTIVNASNQLTSINGNGVTVYAGTSPTSGARVVLNSAGIAGFNGGGSPTFAIDATNGNVSITGASFTSGTISGGSLNIAGNCIISSSGLLTATGASITGAINASTGSIGAFYISGSGNYLSTNLLSPEIGFYISASTGAASFNTFYSKAASGSTGISMTNGANIQMGGGTIAMGGGKINNATEIYATTSIYTSGTGTITSAGAMTSDGELRAAYGALTGNRVSSTPNCWISTTGQIRFSTSSSERYKENITDIRNVFDCDPRKLLDLPVRAFTLKEDFLSSSDDRQKVMIPGFIAEEVDAIYPIAADYDAGQVESWNDRIIVPALLALIQDQETRIKALETK